MQTLTTGNQLDGLDGGLFKNCANLTSIEFGSNIKAIGDETFSGCTALTEVTLSPALETIGASAFANCFALSTIIMGAEVKTIGDKAFNGTKSENIYITALTPPSASNNTFTNYNGKLYLQTKEAIDAYYDAYTCWDRFSSYEMKVPTSMKLENNEVTGKPGQTIQLSATLQPEDVTLPQIFWYSLNPDVATVDHNGLVTLVNREASSATRAAEVKECKIIARSLYANGPMAEFTVKGEVSGVEIIMPDQPGSTEDGTINYNEPYDVYTIGGVKVGGSIDTLARGIYILRQGSKAVKVAL